MTYLLFGLVAEVSLELGSALQSGTGIGSRSRRKLLILNGFSLQGEVVLTANPGHPVRPVFILGMDTDMALTGPGTKPMMRALPA